MSGKKGLIPVQRMVTRNGKTFTQTVYIKAKHKNKVDRQKKVEIPDWNFTSEDDFKKEVDRINNLHDRSERQLLKEHLLNHIETDMKVSWDKVPDTEERAFVRNTMRAFSAAKKHLKNNPVKVTPKPAKKGSVTITKQPGKDYIMDRDTSKKMARDVRDKYGYDNLLDILKANNITWNEVPEEGPNRMRALRALASFLRKGGELGESNQSKQQLVINEPDKKLTKSKYEKDSIPYDYENAKPRHKLIGLATGVLPVDDETADYLEDLLKKGQFGVLSMYEQRTDYGLPKLMMRETSKMFSKTSYEFKISDDYLSLHRQVNSRDIRRYIDIFENPSDKAIAEKTLEAMVNFENKWNGDYYYHEGTSPAITSTKIIDILQDSDSDWKSKDGKDVMLSITKKIEETAKMGDKDEVNKLWDDLEIDRFFEGRANFKDRDGVLTYFYKVCTGNSNIATRTMVSRIANGVIGGKNSSDIEKLQKGIEDGTISKAKVLEVVSKELNSNLTLSGRKTNMVQLMADDWDSDGYSFLRSQVRKSVSNNEPFNEDKLRSTAKEILSDLADLSTPDAMYIQTNIYFASEIRDMYLYNRQLSGKVYEPIERDVFDNSRDLKHTLRVHLGTQRQKTDKAKEKYRKKFEDKKDFNYGEALKASQNPEKLEYLDADEAKKRINATLMKVPDDEAKRVADKVQETHDRQNHSFKTKVHGVYRVKRIASEDKFQKINDDINNTGYYYHGTSFETSQKILGETGGFKVFRGGSNIKAGSMLGYGIYLASQSSKSMQYVGNGFRSGNRGVLFLCKASLGKTVHTTKRGQYENQPLMDDPNTDTVWMDRPYVVNPEWAVKRAEQAVPRLWIDAERI